ncbi:MAG TPA: carbamoyltransferase N-terminal domain-containing protein [Thermoanaerobaculia bacterium]|jgi:carbamoyltransferase|nr:carbamoyltransferase N-terminal domain-containing protein [Thermoanaerobaculia bacterium]
MNIVGLSAFFHESACCLLRDGVLVAAAEEERFSRVKHDSRLPVSAFRFCLEAGGIGVTEVDCVAYYEVPILKLTRQLWSGIPMDGVPDPGRPERMIREMLGWEGPVLCFEHHASHAASAFFGSGFPEAAVLTVDGVGEWATTTYGAGRGAALERIAEVEFPHSLGLLYSAITSWLGFAVNDGEYKVMGLAPYGAPRFLDAMRRLVQSGPGERFRLDLQYFDFIRGRQMFSPRLSELLGAPPRQRGDGITQLHMDVARSVQVVLEEILLEKVDWLHRQTGLSDLCMAGGVALNVVANGRILREGPFERLFVQPAAGDSGGCLGAAALAHAAMTGERPGLSTDGEAMRHAFLGPRWSPEAVAALVAATGLPAVDFRNRTAELLEAVVDRLTRGEVVGWFHGALEMGPRALGARSLLADPRDPGMRDRLNRLVKKREAFRPFAPSVLADHAAEHFALDHPSPFMLETCAVTSPLALPAITHVDGSARPQTVDPAVAPRYAALLAAFERRTGCPLLVNTSFNVAGEPIVASPVDALLSLGMSGASGIDALVLEDFLLDRADLPDGWGERLAAWTVPQRSTGPRSAISEELYTFV